jgi:hypothetical protein
VIELSGVRTKQRVGLPIEYTAKIKLDGSGRDGEPYGRFIGKAVLPASYLTMHVLRANAYAVHGPADARVYHAHAPVPGAAPDFHRLECFVPCTL